MNKLTQLALIVALCLPLHFANAVPSVLVINEVYTGGGNTNATFNRDFVELFNNGIAAADISGLVLSYTNTSGTNTAIFTFGAGTFLAAGQSVVISAGSGGAVGASLPNVAFVGASVNLAGAGGSIQIVNGATTVDLVGYGTSTSFEGAAAAPASTSVQSIQRTAGVDTDNNSVDFTNQVPTPVPEPATYMLMGFGILVCAQQFRRRKG